MMKPEYIFLDNWVFKIATESSQQQSLISYIHANGLTVILTSASLTEVYNPGWRKANGPDRVDHAVDLLEQVPCAIVDPVDVFSAEGDNGWRPLSELPIRLDLETMSAAARGEVLRMLLRRDPVCLNMGRDIAAWAENVRKLKENWLSNVDDIIANGIGDGYLTRNKRGRVNVIKSEREVFLYSLDARLVARDRLDALLKSHTAWRKENGESWITTTRLISLLTMHAYIDIDPASQIKRQGSDIIDIFHLSLAAYCSTLTTDKNMLRVLQAVRKSGVRVSCQVMSQEGFRQALGR